MMLCDACTIVRKVTWVIEVVRAHVASFEEALQRMAGLSHTMCYTYMKMQDHSCEWAICPASVSKQTLVVPGSLGQEVCEDVKDRKRS